MMAQATWIPLNDLKTMKIIGTTQVFSGKLSGFCVRSGIA